MNELFHTEDCALSLICRCCRSPVCERYLTRADRMKVQRDLWPHHGPQRIRSDPKLRAERYLFNSHFYRRLLSRVALRALVTQRKDEDYRKKYVES
jgi:hypothetical protein